jgi:hypothetical protein
MNIALQKKLLGPLPNEVGFRKQMRIHQAWWRACVLAEKPGFHPYRNREKIGSTILDGDRTGKNFLSENILNSVKKTIEERDVFGAGMLAEDRLFNNLLSSQPLCFNFFGELMMDSGLALQILRCFYPNLTGVTRVIFEFAPKENYTKDNSAFDVAFEVMQNDKLGLIGLECKYTDSFSHKEYDKEEYRSIFQESTNFSDEYDTYKSTRYNQLFRNQLIAEALKQNQRYEFVYTGLFCHHEDVQALKIGVDFRKMLVVKTSFQVITYKEYIEKVMQLPLRWEIRELIMMLWVRYCGMQLSTTFTSAI